MVSLLGLGGYAIYVAHTSDGAVSEIAPGAAVEAVPVG